MCTKSSFSIRVYLFTCCQLVQDPCPLDYDEQNTAPTPVVPSLADVLWVARDEGQAFARFR